ncbi:MAG: pseudouridine synthase [Candidatus Nanoarchaeia archaeon]
MVKKKRLYQVLRQTGLINTKQDCLKLLNSGRVTIDGRITKNADFQFNPKKKILAIDGKPIELKDEKYYFMLNKPPKYLSHRKRSHGKKSLLELFDLPENVKNVINPVGRLDYESRGLILLTNDGDFAHKILRPQSHLGKEYEVLINGELTDELKNKLEEGIEIEIGGDTRKGQEKIRKIKTKPCQIKIIERNNQTTLFKITLTEGKRRQIREMITTINLKVLDLKRIRIGKLKLENLKEGEYKEFTKDDILPQSPQ